MAIGFTPSQHHYQYVLYDFYRQLPPGPRVTGTQYFPYFDLITKFLRLLLQLGIFSARLELGIDVLFGLPSSLRYLRQSLFPHVRYGRGKGLTLFSPRLNTNLESRLRSEQSKAERERSSHHLAADPGLQSPSSSGAHTYTGITGPPRAAAVYNAGWSVTLRSRRSQTRVGLTSISAGTCFRGVYVTLASRILICSLSHPWRSLRHTADGA